MTAQDAIIPEQANTPTIQLWSSSTTTNRTCSYSLISRSGNHDLWRHCCFSDCAFVTQCKHNWPESPALPGSLVGAKFNQRFLVPVSKRSHTRPPIRSLATQPTRRGKWESLVSSSGEQRCALASHQRVNDFSLNSRMGLHWKQQEVLDSLFEMFYMSNWNWRK